MIKSVYAKALVSFRYSRIEEGAYFSHRTPKQADSRASCVSGQHRSAANSPASSVCRLSCVFKEKNSRANSPGSVAHKWAIPSSVLPEMLRVRKLNGSGLLHDSELNLRTSKPAIPFQ